MITAEPSALIDEARVLSRAGSHEAALENYDLVIDRYKAAGEPAVRRVVASAWSGRAYECIMLERWLDAQRASERVLAEPSLDANSPAIAHALLRKGRALEEQGQWQGALAATDELLGRFGGSHDGKLDDVISAGWSTKIDALYALGQPDAAHAEAAQLIARFDRAPSERTRRVVARTLFRSARELHSAGQTEEALRRFDQLLASDGGVSPSPAAFPRCDVLLAKAFLLRGSQRLDQSTAVLDTLIAQYGDDPDSAVRDRLGRALLLKSLNLLTQDATRDALVELDRLVMQFAGPVTERQRTTLAHGLVLRGLALRRLGRLPEAIASWQQVVDRFEHDPPADEPFVALEAIRLRSEAQAAQGRVDEALSALDHVLAQYEPASSPEARIGLVEALSTKARLLAHQNNRRDADESFRRLHRIVGEEADTATLAAMTEAILLAAGMMVTSADTNLALPTLDALVEKLSPSRSFAERTAFARAQIFRAVYLARLGRIDEAVRSYEALFDLGDAVLPTWDDLARRGREGRARPLVIAAELGRAATLEGMARHDEALRAIDSVLDEHSGPTVAEIKPFIAWTKLARAALESTDPPRPRHDAG